MSWQSFAEVWHKIELGSLFITVMVTTVIKLLEALYEFFSITLSRKLLTLQ
jgi:hypothetical protein